MMTYSIHSATYTGRSHRQSDCPCQDRVFHQHLGNVWAVSLSDGAGSRPHSHIGADLVTQTVCHFLIHRFDWCWTAPQKELTTALMNECISVLTTATYHNEDMACTLLGYACHRDGRHIALHLGDGVIIASDGDEVFTLSPPENGLHQNETFFVTTYNSSNHLRIQHREIMVPGGILLMSDGMSESLYHHPSGAPAPACDRIFQWMQEADVPLDDVLTHHMETLFSKHSSDDLSLIAMDWQEEPLRQNVLKH